MYNSMEAWLQHKRYRIALISIILLVLFGVVGVIFKYETAVTVAIGGIPTIAVAYIAGDSYRPSAYKETYSREEYSVDSTGEMLPPGADPSLFG